MCDNFISMLHLKIGDKAPQFTGVVQNGEEIKLSDFLGSKLILYFYPKDNTPGCINQACNLRDHMDELVEKGFQVIGISADDEKMHTKFATKHQLNFPLIADTKKRIINKYGVWGPKKFMGREYDGIHRTTFVINEKGRIIEIITKPKTKYHAEEILQLLTENVQRK